MSVLVAVQVVMAWLVVLFLLHRLNIQRLRGHARLVALRRLDWDALLHGLLPEGGPGLSNLPATLPDGAPTPEILRKQPPPGSEARHSVLVDLVSGKAFPEPERVFEDAGFSGGDVRWLTALARMSQEPLAVLEALEAVPARSAAELYLREYLRLSHRLTLFNLELEALGARRRLALGMMRFGNVPALHFGRALAASLVGWNLAAVNDLARAVYFSHTSGFYLRAVLDTPWLEEVRPELMHQCRKAWNARTTRDSLPK